MKDSTKRRIMLTKIKLRLALIETPLVYAMGIMEKFKMKNTKLYRHIDRAWRKEAKKSMDTISMVALWQVLEEYYNL